MTGTPVRAWTPGHRVALAVVTLAALAFRLITLRLDDGLIYPDEVHQSLEQAHRLAFGAGLVPWEFRLGARHWALPALLAAVMRLGEWLHLAPQLAARGLIAVGTGATAWACARLVRGLGGSATSQLLAAVTWAALNLGVLLGVRALSESAALFPLTLGLAWALERSATRAHLVLAGALLSLAVMFRLHLGLFAVGALATVVARRDWSAARWLGASLLAGALVMGVVDLASWGSFFHSAREYLRFNLVEGRAAAEFGRQGWSYYPVHLWRSTWLVTPLLVAGAVLAARRAPALLAMVTAFVLLHVATPHKELRFLLPALPLLGALAGLGLDSLTVRPHLARLGPLALIGALLLGQPRLERLTFRALGVPDGGDLDAPALDAGGPENRLLALAGQRAEVCGVEVRTRQLGYTGATAWFHRDVPLFGAEKPPANPRSVNALIAPRGLPEELLAADGDVALYRLAAGCEPAPDFDHTLH